jgi:crotonobetainyl-CoA:carnitine CoA-transferase CaiB-like acyl-CoA transferase
VFDVLKGIRVLEFGKFVAAPYATWLLSNMGAEVIKIEPPGGAADREPFRLSDKVNGAVLSDAVSAWCRRLTTTEALAALREARVPGSSVNSLQEALEEPQVQALQFIQTMSHPGLSAGLPLFKAPVMVDGALAPLRSRPPLPGEHTDFILRRAGYSAHAIEALRAAKVV